MTTTTITVPTDTPFRRPRRAGLAKRCPSCATPLDGGPVRFRCAPCGKAVMAADLDTEYHASNTTTGTRSGRAAA